MRTIIIAEAGINHNGSFILAKKLIQAAARAGADYVKFQTFETKDMIKENTKLVKYQRGKIGKNLSQYNMLKKYQLKKNLYKKLVLHASKNKIKLLSSPFDIGSIKFLKKFNFDFIKIPSGEINNFPYLREIGKLNKKIILSTGMSSIKEVEAAIKILTKYGTNRKNITLLHCHSDYPSRPEDLNLNSILTLKKKFNLNVGFSDHSIGVEAPIISIVLGAKVIEKHLTLNNKLKGPDHKASIEPNDFKKMVLAIRNAEKMLGDGKKIASKNESKIKRLVRKSIVAKKEIKKGEKFSEENLTTKRPGIGLSPMKFENLINMIAKRNYKKDDFIK